MVSRRTGIPVTTLSLDDRLLHDLGVDGDDAAAILSTLARELRVDMSGLDMEKHFRPEPNLFSVLRRRSTKKKEFAEKVPVTIRDLIGAVEVGKWPL